MRRIMIAIALVIRWTPVWAATDIEFYDEDGTTVSKASGELLEESLKDVLLKTDKDELRIPVYRIVSIKYDGQPPALLNIRNLETQRRFEEAEKEYNGFLPTLDQARQPYLYTSVNASLFKCKAAMAMTDAAKLKSAIDWYEKNAESFATSRHFYPLVELAGQLYMAAGDYAKADETFVKLKGVEWPGYKEKALVYQGLAAVRKEKPIDAILAFDEVLKSSVDSPAVREQKRIAKIAKADALVMSNKAAEAEKLAREAIDELTAEERDNLLARARNTLGDALVAQKKDKEAVLDGYMWVHVLYDGDTNEHARAVYNLSILFKKINYPDRAQQMADLLKSSFGQTEWAKKATGS